MLRAVASAAVAAVLLLSPPGLAQDAGGTATALAANGDALDATPLDLAAVTEDDSALMGRELLGRKRRPRHKRGGKKGKKGHGGKKKKGRGKKKKAPKRKGGKKKRGGGGGGGGKKKRGGFGKFLRVHGGFADEGNEGDEGDEGHGGGHSFTVTKKTTHRSSVRCSATASSASFSSSRNAHVSATANAFKAACSNGKKKVDLVAVFKKGAAHAIAAAITSASAKCTATGNAFGCASAQSAARAWASATASAHATAAASAINLCKCKNKPAFAAAFSSGGAESFKTRIVADVASDASADVCVKSSGKGGTATAAVDVISRCIEIKYAYVMAEAAARALIAGNCRYGTTAQADIEAIVSGKEVSKKKC